MISKIIVGLLAFLLGIFPNWGGLQYQYQQMTYNRTVIADSIIEAVLARDIAALEAISPNPYNKI